jgi:Flp pilus assembly protein TadD
LEKFPSDYIDDEEKALAAELNELSKKPLLNLSGLTNTELKERYGVANLTRLETIGDDYDKSMMLISSLASKRLENKDYRGALSYLEFAAGTKTDVSSVYIMLGKCYSELGETEKIRDIINIVKSLDFSLKDKVIENLSSYFPGL